MNLDDVILRISSLEMNPHQYLEVFLFNLLKAGMDNDNTGRTIIKLKGGDIGDAFCPRGVASINGGTIVTYSTFGNRPDANEILNDINLLINLSGGRQNVRNLLLISINSISDSYKQSIAKTLRRVYGLDFYFWDSEEINGLIDKNSVFATKILDNLFSVKMKTIVSGKRIDWKLQRRKIFDELKVCYKRGHFSLFLGAGVSSSAGMPDWSKLLNSLFVSYLSVELDTNGDIADENIDKFVSRFNEVNESSALMAARYLRKGMSFKSKVFSSEISKNLYGLRDKKINEDSELIKSISALCMPRRTGSAIKSVITYNFDDLLEKQLKKQKINYRSMYHDHDTYDPDELPIYHVHGFLPEDKDNYDGVSSELIFSEEGYHQLYSEPYHWSNLVQLACLRENNCLLIGLSINDPNLRRLLDISMLHTGQSKHYAFMKRLSLENFCYDNGRVKVIDDEESAEKYLEKHHDLSAALLQELGVKTIWFETYDEIPTFLDELYECKN